MANPKSTKALDPKLDSADAGVTVTNSDPVSDSVVPPDPKCTTGESDMNYSLSKSSETSAQITASQLKSRLPQEVVDLVIELRETVKRIDPKKHTANSLRRALSSVSDILSDIETLSIQRR